ncbi:MAG: hypothetical protein U9N09_05655, partial [Euryarchaeota archaeon]|nr:hypothetical protein [Euryarchaeota archaeon]
GAATRAIYGAASCRAISCNLVVLCGFPHDIEHVRMILIYSLWEDPQEWLEHYLMRSISETVNSMVKCRFGAPLEETA